MFKVLKRSGELTEFNIEKIETAITKAFESNNKNYEKNIIQLLALRASADFEKKIKDNIIRNYFCNNCSS